MIIKFFKIHSDAQIPTRANPTDSGMDLTSVDDDFILNPGERRLVKTGLKMSIQGDSREYYNSYTYFPYGRKTTSLQNTWELQIRPRSGLALKHGITVLNSPGTIDCVAKGTKIRTLSEDKLVEDIFEENKKTAILSFNEENNSIDEDAITEMWIEENKDVLEIELESGESVVVASTKEVFTKRGWIHANELNGNDEILTH